MILTFSTICTSWATLPQVIATHFDISGQPNGWSNKDALWKIAGFEIFTFVAISIMCRFPHTYNYMWPITESNARGQYMLARKFLRLLKFESLSILFLITWTVIQVANSNSKSADITRLILATAVMLISCAIYMKLAFNRR